MVGVSDLIRHRDYYRERAEWQSNGELRAACSNRTAFGTTKTPDHANCGFHGCGCECHRPTPAERDLWTLLADEIDAFLAREREPEQVDLFGNSP